MPMYEYECAACGKFEARQRISEEPLKACKSCGQPVRRLISTTSFALKGGGWYGDGYASGGSAKGGKSETAPAAPAAASTDTKAAGGCGAGACGTGACASALPN